MSKENLTRGTGVKPIIEAQAYHDLGQAGVCSAMNTGLQRSVPVWVAAITHMMMNSP